MGQNVFVTSQDVVRAEVCVYGSKCSCGVLVRVANSGMHLWVRVLGFGVRVRV